MLQACHKCGIGFDMELVPANPFKLCPNPACNAPLDKDAAEHTFVEAGNPSDTKDAMRVANRSNLLADVERHQAAAAAAVASSRPTRSIDPATPA